MISRSVLYTIIGTFIIVAFIFSASTGYLKKPLSEKDNVESHIISLNKALNAGNWSAADKEIKALKSAWEPVRTRVQLTWDSDDIKDFDEQLDKLGFDIQKRNRRQAQDNLALLRSIWDELGKL